MFIDTHCHLEMILQYAELQELSPEHILLVKKIIYAAQEQGINRIITIGTTYRRCIQGVTLAHACDGVYATIGIHPCDITDDWKTELKKLEEAYLKNRDLRVVGIGETGLDYYHLGFDKEVQKTVFRYQIELALKYNLALVVHSRSAIDETLDILREYQKNGLRAVIHCFSEPLAIAQEVIHMGFMMGIGGIITYPKNEYLREIIRTVGLENIVLETDSPFLPPQHMRGKPNSPVEVRTVAEYCSQLINLSIEQVGATTTSNAERLFQM